MSVDSTRDFGAVRVGGSMLQFCGDRGFCGAFFPQPDAESAISAAMARPFLLPTAPEGRAVHIVGGCLCGDGSEAAESPSMESELEISATEQRIAGAVAEVTARGISIADPSGRTCSWA